MYRNLSIDIIHTEGSGEENPKASVEAGLQHFFQPEIREINCEKCDEGTHAYQTLQIISR